MTTPTRPNLGQTPVFLAVSLAIGLCWGLLAPLAMPNITLDAAEGLSWGASLQWGYLKHPPLQAWLLRLTEDWIGSGSMAHVWLSGVCITLAHIGVWRAATPLLGAHAAAWASLSLQTIFHFNFALPEFNPNVLMLPIWAWGGCFALAAVRANRLADWLALGAVLAIGMYAKYMTALLVLVIAVFLIATAQGRARLLGWKPWAGAALAGALLAPHLAWMLAADAPTVGYAVARADQDSGSPILLRLENLAQYLATLLGTAAILLAALHGGRDRNAPAAFPIAPADGRLLTALALGPALGILAIAVVLGFEIKSAWLGPVFMFFPVWLFWVWRINVSAPRWRIGARIVAAAALSAIAIFFAANALRPILESKPMRVHFPGPALAALLAQQWGQTGAQSEPVIIGPTHVAGSAGHYMSGRPLVRIEADGAQTPWVTPAEIAAHGGFIVWDVQREGAPLPAAYAAAFPEARVLGVWALPYQTATPIPAAQIGVALIAPPPSAP